MSSLIAIKPWRPGPGFRAPPRLRLFCIPYAGGGAMVYRTWASAMPAGVELCAIQLPGREERLTDPLLTEAGFAAEAIADALGPHLDIPFGFFGHSMGAGLAYATARAVMRNCGRAAELLMVSGRRAPHLPSRRPVIHALPDDLFVEELKRLNGTPPEVLAHAELMELMLPVLRADFRIAESQIEAVSVAPLPCPVTAFGGTADPDVPVGDLLAWRAVNSGAFRLHMLEGDHFFLNTNRANLLAIVADELLNAMAR